MGNPGVWKTWRKQSAFKQPTTRANYGSRGILECGKREIFVIVAHGTRPWDLTFVVHGTENVKKHKYTLNAELFTEALTLSPFSRKLQFCSEIPG